MGLESSQSALQQIQHVREPEKRRDGVVKHEILVVRLWLQSSERAGKLLHAAALCLMS